MYRLDIDAPEVQVKNPHIKPNEHRGYFTVGDRGRTMDTHNEFTVIESNPVVYRIQFLDGTEWEIDQHDSNMERF